MKIQKYVNAMRHAVFSGNFEDADSFYKQYKLAGGKRTKKSILNKNPYPKSPRGKAYKYRVKSYLKRG